MPTLPTIATQITNCRTCKRGKIGLPVPGEGSANAKIMFVGEAPGKTEAATGRPFVGRSGKLLRSLIVAAGLTEKEVYITSPVKYLPKRGTPTLADIAHGKIHLDQQIACIKPKYIVLLGAVACRAVLGARVAVMLQHGTTIQKEGVNYFITVHPAAGLRFPPLKKLLEGDFKKLKKCIV